MARKPSVFAAALRAFRSASRLVARVAPPLVPTSRGAQRPARRSAPDAMSRRSFEHAGTRHVYWLHLPASAPSGPQPLVLMLHGCKQTAAAFAAATQMNAVADRLGFAVAYAQQSVEANRMRCWNWFDRRSQNRRGESALLAALAQDAARKAGADRHRVFVAGLSAGGAMALALASEHPDVFAAAGVHSGVPPGSASDVFTALRVMKNGPRAAARTGRPFVRFIAFHGDADRTVHPGNGEAIWSTAESSGDPGRAALTGQDESVEAFGRRPALRRRLVDASGRALAEHWTVKGLGHAWSGGASGGSFSDPSGPDASTAMAQFFLALPRVDRTA